MKRLLLIISLLPFLAQGQKTFTEKELLAVVRKYHPVARQAALDVGIATANITASRGAFDPVISSSADQKTFDNITYYNQRSAELKIPTWYGIDVYAGKATVDGSRINPEETKGSIRYMGVSFPLVQNALFDKRRAALRSAQILKDAAIADRQAAMNDLVAEALLAYTEWWLQYRLLQATQSSVENAQRRYSMVRSLYRLGERPAMDTVEAATQVQALEQQATEAFMLLEKSRLELSIYLWKEANVPFELPKDAVPTLDNIQTPPPIDSLLVLANAQPSLIAYDYKLKELSIDRKLKFQSLLPAVTAKYQELGRDRAGIFKEALFENNYRYGLTFSMPLRLSEGRGTYRAAGLKIEQATVARIAKQVTLQNKVKQYYIAWNQTIRQFRQQQHLLRNYLLLQKGEETKLANGESSLFLVNAREAKTIEALQKEITLEAKIRQSAIRAYWAAGVFAQEQ